MRSRGERLEREGVRVGDDGHLPLLMRRLRLEHRDVSEVLQPSRKQRKCANERKRLDIPSSFFHFSVCS